MLFESRAMSIKDINRNARSKWGCKGASTVCFCFCNRLGGQTARVQLEFMGHLTMLVNCLLCYIYETNETALGLKPNFSSQSHLHFIHIYFIKSFKAFGFGPRHPPPSICQQTLRIKQINVWNGLPYSACTYFCFYVPHKCKQTKHNYETSTTFSPYGVPTFLLLWAYW